MVALDGAARPSSMESRSEEFDAVVERIELRTGSRFSRTSLSPWWDRRMTIVSKDSVQNVSYSRHSQWSRRLVPGRRNLRNGYLMGTLINLVDLELTDSLDHGRERPAGVRSTHDRCVYFHLVTRPLICTNDQR